MGEVELGGQNLQSPARHWLGEDWVVGVLWHLSAHFSSTPRIVGRYGKSRRRIDVLYARRIIRQICRIIRQFVRHNTAERIIRHIL